MACNYESFSDNSNNHNIIKEFRKNNATVNSFTRSLIDVKNNLFFLYDISKSCILVTPSISLLYETPIQKYQIFKPVKPVEGKVSTLKVSEDCKNAALLSDVGIYIMDLPNVGKTCCLHEQFNNVSYCKYVWLYVPVEMTYPTPKVIEIKWHPIEHVYLVVLSTDNSIRFVDTLIRDEVWFSLDIMCHSQDPTTEFALDFDFLRKRDPFGDNWKRIGITTLVIGKANGEVLKGIFSTRGDQRCTSKQQHFVIFPEPPRTSVCSLIVLQCTPPIVIFTDNSGNIHHSLLFEDKNQLVLRIFEKFQMKEFLSRIENVPNSLKLIYDSLSPDNRYFFIHDAGVHSAMLPVVSSIKRFLSKTKGCRIEEYLRLKVAIQTCRSVVECVRYTLLPDMMTPQPIYGIGLIPHRLKTHQVIVLLADATTATFFVDAIFPLSKHQIKTKIDKSINDEKTFVNLTSNFLTKNQCKRPSVMEVINECRGKTIAESSKIYLESLATLREYGLNQHTFISDIIVRKTEELREKEKQQLYAIEALKTAKEELKRNAERIAERYEEINDKDSLIMKRVENMEVFVGGSNTIRNKKQLEEFNNVEKKTCQLQETFQEDLNKYKILKDEELIQANEKNKSFQITKSHNTTIRSKLDVLTEKIRDLKIKTEDMSQELGIIQNKI